MLNGTNVPPTNVGTGEVNSNTNMASTKGTWNKG
jgi:hypothetical protein